VTGRFGHRDLLSRRGYQAQIVDFYGSSNHIVDLGPRSIPGVDAQPVKKLDCILGAPRNNDKRSHTDLKRHTATPPFSGKP
jgi:hypothetical protein